MESDDQFGFVKMVAISLMEKSIGLLYKSNKRKAFPEHVGAIAEILDWAEEFYDQYYKKTLDWQTFKLSKENIHSVTILDDLIAAFGEEQLKTFFAKHKNHQTYFLAKYFAIYERKS